MEGDFSEFWSSCDLWGKGERRDAVLPCQLGAVMVGGCNFASWFWLSPGFPRRVGEGQREGEVSGLTSQIDCCVGTARRTTWALRRKKNIHGWWLVCDSGSSHVSHEFPLFLYEACSAQGIISDGNLHPGKL